MLQQYCVFIESCVNVVGIMARIQCRTNIEFLHYLQCYHNVATTLQEHTENQKFYFQFRNNF